MLSIERDRRADWHWITIKLGDSMEALNPFGQNEGTKNTRKFKIMALTSKYESVVFQSHCIERPSSYAFNPGSSPFQVRNRILSLPAAIYIPAQGSLDKQLHVKLSSLLFHLCSPGTLLRSLIRYDWLMKADSICTQHTEVHQGSPNQAF